MPSRLSTVLLASLLLASSACVVVGDSNGAPPGRPADHAGPPPHAPAHGYRHQHRGRVLRFDSELGVYVVVNLRDVWFLDGSYFRIFGDGWQISGGVDGPWRVASRRAVPVRLYQKRHPHGGPPGQLEKEARKSKH